MKRAKRREPPPAVPAKGVRWRAVVIALAGALTYANSLSGPFMFDDRLTLVGDPQSQNSQGVAAPRESPLAGRPFVVWTFVANHAVGGLDVTGYHVANVAVHLTCALLFYGL